MLVGDNRGHKFLVDICDMIWHLPDGEGDVWIFDTDKKEPALKYELKNLSDFLNRLTSDTLNMQLERIDGIVVIGLDEELLGSYWGDFGKLNDVLNGVEDHTRVYRVKDTAHLERFLRLREEKVKDGTYGLIEKRKRKVKGYPSMVESLTNIDKVSYTIAQRIYEDAGFDSLEDLVFEARQIRDGRLDIEKSRFCKIDKVGKVIAQKVVDWALQGWPRKERLT